jgi:hypothetical protein
MMRTLISLLLAGLAGSVLGPNRAAAESSDAVAAIAVDWLDDGQLLYRISSSLEQEVGSVNGQYLRATEKPQMLRAEPPYGSNKPRYFVWSAQGGPRVLVLDESKGPGKGYDRLFVDQNGDGVLTEGEQVRGWRRQGSLTFGPVKVFFRTANGPQTYHVLVRTYTYDHGSLESACYSLGRIRLGDQSYKVALVDNNANGVFNDLSTTPGGGDRLLIDLDGDGKFTVNTPGDPETFPLSKLLQIGGEYFTLEVAPDGSRLATAVPPLKFGQVRSDSGAFQVMLASGDGLLRLRSDDGQAKVPVGEYRLAMVWLTRTDGQGRRWELLSYGRGEAGSAVKVAEGRTTELQLGPPLQAKARAYVRGREVSFSLQLSDAAGLGVSNITVDGQRPPAPKLRIRSAAGQEIGCYDFHYG